MIELCKKYLPALACAGLFSTPLLAAPPGAVYGNEAEIMAEEMGEVLVTVSADVNRDGVVTDTEMSRGPASLESGPLMLFNCDDDDGDGQPDHMDNKVNGPEDMKDLAPIRVTLVVQDESALESFEFEVDNALPAYVRFFVEKDGELVRWDTSDPLPLVEQPDGKTRVANLFAEARYFADGTWNGRINLTARAKTAEGMNLTSSQSLRVAPWIMLAGLEKGEVVYVREYPDQNDEFLASLREIVPAAGAKLEIIPGDAPYSAHNIWLQDTMEIGYTQAAGDPMNVVLKANRNKPLDNFAKDQLLGPDYGWFESGQFREEFGAGNGGTSWIDWFGNLEVTPPLKGYPNGRVFYGVTSDGASLNPDVVRMINAQEIQGPAIPINVEFLLIKHVDEIINFVPTGDQIGRAHV